MNPSICLQCPRLEQNKTDWRNGIVMCCHDGERFNIPTIFAEQYWNQSKQTFDAPVLVHKYHKFKRPDDCPFELEHLLSEDK